MKIDLGGRKYKIGKLSAFDAKRYLDADRSDATLEMLFRCVEVLTPSGWIALGDSDLINQHVESWIELTFLENKAEEINFDFLKTWRFRRISGNGVSCITPKYCDPLFFSLICAQYATLHELKTVYTLEDAFMMMDALITTRINEQLAAKGA